MNRIRKAVILAGGLGTRLLPLTRDIPKEMLPLGTKPILEHIVDELKAARLEEILIVSREGKSTIAKHFAQERGVRILEKKEALGPGHSVMAAREFLGNEDFLVAFGDAPLGGGHVSEFVSNLLAAHESLNAAAVLAVERVPESEIHLRAIVKPVKPLKPRTATPIAELVQKPKPSSAPGDWALAGRYTFSPVVLDSLAIMASGAVGEIILADAIKHMLSEGKRIYALPLGEDQHRFDTGSLDGYLKALHAFTENSLKPEE